MLTFIQITDTHIFADKEIMYGIDSAKALENAIEDIHVNYPDASFVVHTGDIAGYKGRVEDFKRFSSIIDSLSIPIHYIPGNHDIDRSILRSELLKVEPSGGAVCWSFTMEDRHFIGLDSSTGNDLVGEIAEEELNWLRKDLESKKEKQTFIFLHHHVLPVGVHWLDKLILRNNLELLELIDSFPGVECIINGHVHLEKTLVFRGKTFFSTPSLCEQYPAHVQTFAVEGIPPGYRVFHLKDNGSVESYIKRLNYKPQNTEYTV